MKKSCIEKIICPTCGAEYLPCEIYINKYFIGNCKNIVKDKEGKIINYFGTPLDLKEKYICDYCDKSFKVTTKVNFTAETDTKSDFTDDYTSNIYGQQLTFFEDDF